MISCADAWSKNQYSDKDDRKKDCEGGQDRSTNMDYGGKGASDDWNKERRNPC